MNKRQLLLGTIIILSITFTPEIARACTGQTAQQAAESVIINRQLVDESAVRQRGREYSTDFLAAFAQASARYQQMFYLGVQDANAGKHPQQFTDQLSQAAYQRGYAHVSPQFPKSPSEVPDDHVPSAQQPTEKGPDEQEYPMIVPAQQQTQFVRRLAKVAQRIGSEYDLYPSVIIAQAALESNWGTSSLSNAPYHNLFGVKGYFSGRATDQPTVEYENGQRLVMDDHFRWYDNDYQALEDYAQTLQTPLYRGTHRSQARTYREATRALVGKYATDPQYDRKLNYIIDSYQLTQYDQPLTRSQELSASSKNAHLQSSTVKDKSSHQSSTPPSHQHSLLVPFISGLGSAGLLGLVKWLGLFK